MRARTRRSLSRARFVLGALLLLLSSTVRGVYAEPAASGSHVVEPGETLWAIADAAGTDTTTLARLNNLADTDVLSVGQSLKLPGAAAVGATAGPSATYAVLEGDTLWGISQQLGTTTAALAEANGLDDANRVVVGMQLRVPGGSGAPGQSPTQAASTPAAGAAVVARAPASPDAKRSLLVPYTVQAGETLSQIARRFGTRAEAIAQASGLDDPNRLPLGSVLKVPVPGREHVVAPGETLRDIAAQEKVDLGSLIDLNELEEPSLIRAGQTLLVPGASAPPTLQAAVAQHTAAPAPAAPTAAPVAPNAAAAAPNAAPAAPPSPGSAPATSAPPAASGTSRPSGAGAVALKPAPPRAPVAPPPGAPTDGLAGAGLKLLNAPYVWGGSSPSGFDCSGYIWYVARQAGKSIGRGLLGQYNAGAHPAREELKPGDLVFFQNTYVSGLSHNGIFIGGNRFVHAADEQAGVTISDLGTAYWSSHWFGATRLP